MARHYLTSTGEIKRYSRRQQKSITMRRLGLDIDNPTDQRTYKSIYDDLTRRTRQYNILQDLQENSKLSPADMLFDIANSRLKAGETSPATLHNIQNTIRQRGYEYSATIQNLYNQRLQASTSAYSRKVRANPQTYIDAAVQNELNVFNKFLNTAGVDNDLIAINEWLQEPQTVYINIETGEIVTEPPSLIDQGKFITDTVPRRAILKDIKEVRTKLKELAASRKSKYKRVYSDRENNIYHYEIRQAGAK